MFSILFGGNHTRKKLLKNTQSLVMKKYLEKPFPSKKEYLHNIDIVSLDFETTGLNITTDEIVSMGWVGVNNLGVDLQTCREQILNTKGSLSETSVVIHQITDSQSVNGISIEAALPQLLKQLSGKVLLAHNAKIEQGFINNWCQKLYGTKFIIPVIDTQYIAKRSFERQNKTYKGNDLRLFNLRKSFNLPVYKAHNALLDAIATAELFLALVDKISPKGKARLGDFLS